MQRSLVSCVPFYVHLSFLPLSPSFISSLHPVIHPSVSWFFHTSTHSFKHILDYSCYTSMLFKVVKRWGNKIGLVTSEIHSLVKRETYKQYKAKLQRREGRDGEEFQCFTLYTQVSTTPFPQGHTDAISVLRKLWLLRSHLVWSMWELGIVRACLARIDQLCLLNGEQKKIIQSRKAEKIISIYKILSPFLPYEKETSFCIPTGEADRCKRPAIKVNE